MSEFLRLLRRAVPYRGRLGLALLAMVFYAAGSVSQAKLVKDVVDGVLLSNQSVWVVGGLILGAYLLKGVGAFASAYLMTDVGHRVVTELRTSLFRHILDQSAAFFSRKTSGRLMSRITNDVAMVQRAASETAADLIREALAVVGFGAYLFYIDWRLALVIVVSAPLIVYPLVRLGQRVRRMSRRGQEDLERVTHRASEGLTGHRVVKAFGAEAREADRFAASSWRLYRTNMKIAGAVVALPPLMELLGAFASVAILWYGAREIAAGTLSEGEFLSFLAAAFMLYGPVKKLSRVNAGLQQALAAAQRIFEMLDTHTEVPDKPGAPDLAPLTRTVEFRGVGFAYDDEPDRPVLRDISFTVAAGQVAALVGLSGAGKTTLANLIPRFYDVTSGGVFIDGVDLRDVRLKSLRDQIAIVTQETVLFDDTIATNIAYGVPGASPALIEEAARAAHAHEFIVDLPEQYQTQIGERGQRLSGGQRQRLAIARAILKACPLLVLDEATSALDTESELLVQDALANLMRDRTTFVIAHRLSTIRRADLIIALEHGRIVEVGTHDSLLVRPDGVYARLYRSQGFESPAGPAPQARAVGGSP